MAVEFTLTMQDQECEEPAQHARRPMNAFLIFCKRHREIVRDKYPNLENRSITKILGEWWADLDKEEKACYTGLAKQYKDSFLSANPDFKWHKLQVGPPLRTLPSRVRVSTENPIVSCNKYQDHELERTINNSTKFHYNNTSHNSIESPKSNRKDSIRKLQNALTETTRMFEDNFEEKERYGVVNDQMTNQDINDQMTNQDINDQIVDNRFSKDDDGHQRNWSEDEKNSTSGSTCKSYQECMAVGELIVNKRQRRDYPNKLSDEGYNASCSWDPGTSLEEFTVIMIDESNLNADYIQHDITIESEPNVEPNDTPEPDNNAKKKCRAADFDLEATIKTLPSLSLEEFEQKKLERKLKKKSMPVTHRIYGLRCYGKIVKKRKYNITHKHNKKRV